MHHPRRNVTGDGEQGGSPSRLREVLADPARQKVKGYDNGICRWFTLEELCLYK